MARAEVIEIEASLPESSVSRSLKVRSGRPTLPVAALNASIFSMFAAVFSCTTTSTFAGKNMLLPV